MAMMKNRKKNQPFVYRMHQCLVGTLVMVSLSACAADSNSPSASVPPSTPAMPTTVPAPSTLSPAPAQVPAGTTAGFTAGVHYLKMSNTLVPAEKVKVVEFFSYGCPHCFELEKYIEPWVEKNKSNVDFQRVPSSWSPALEILSQAYFTVQILKREDTLHTGLFNAIHRERLNLQSLDAMRSFFVREGVSAEVFDKTFDSFAVKQKVFQSKSAFEKYGLNSVPSIVVADHFVTDVGKAGGHQKLLELLSHLVDLSKNSPAPKTP